MTLFEVPRNESEQQEICKGRLKKGKPNIAPLQPPTLATFRSWGSSAGAGRAGLPGGKGRRLFEIWDFRFKIFEAALKYGVRWRLQGKPSR